MQSRQRALTDAILQDPDVAAVASFIGADGTNPTSNSGRLSIALKRRSERGASAAGVIDRLQARLAGVPGIQVFLQPVQDLQIESRVSRTQFQYTLEDPNLVELNTWARGGLVPGATAFGRVIRFLSKELSTQKGVLGVNLGASAAVIAAALNGELSLGVFPQFGLGAGLKDMLDQVPASDIIRWLTIELTEDDLKNYIYNKALYPASLPVSPEETAIERALARQAIFSASRLAMSTNQKPSRNSSG